MKNRKIIVTLVYDSKNDRLGVIRGDKWGLVQITDSNIYVPFLAFNEMEVISSWWEEVAVNEAQM